MANLGGVGVRHPRNTGWMRIMLTLLAISLTIGALWKFLYGMYKDRKIVLERIS
jgi:hypothetical protein